ncbi:MAG: hypothetical protein ABR527_07385 [Gemmatimonadota bacterium]
MSDGVTPATGAAPRGPGAPDALEWAGWGALGVLTLVILLLALFRPTTPGQLYDEIRLAAGVDRYQAAMNEGDRLYSTARAEIRIVGSDPTGRQSIYRMLAESEANFQTARQEAEGFYENQRAQDALADVYLVWGRSLHEDGTGAWYVPNERATLRRAREIVDEGLALPHITGDRREELRDLGKRINRAITPWPIL